MSWGMLYVQLLLLAKLLFSSYFFLAYCLVYDWLTDCLRDAFVGAYVLREYREIRTRVCAASSSTCWLTLLHDRVLSAVTLSITTWRRTIHGQDGDRLYSVVISTLLVAEFIFMNSQLYLLLLWLALFRWWVEEVNDTSSSLRGSVHLQLYVAFILVQGRQAWKLDIRHSSSFRPSEIWNLLVARASSFFSLSLVVTDRCGTSDPKLEGTFIYN